MKVNKVNIEVNRLANKQHYYLREFLYSFAKDNKIQGEFGNDFVTLKQVPKNLLKVLEDWKIKFRKY